VQCTRLQKPNPLESGEVCILKASVSRLAGKGVPVADDLFSLLECDLSEELILAMTYNMVFDESGKQGSSEVVVFAGFFATAERWREFGLEWNTLLRKEGLTWLHMVDAVQMNGDYAKFRDRVSDLESLLLSLASTVCKYAREGLINRAFVKEFEALDQSISRRYKDPFYYAFEGGIEALSKSPTLEPNDRFNLVCDDSDDAGECLKAYRRLAKLKPEIHKRFGMICFGDDKSYTPLQAADMFAYCARRVSSGLTDDISAKVLAQFLQVFSDHSRQRLRAEE
jgi:hypothetical protein